MSTDTNNNTANDKTENKIIVDSTKSMNNPSNANSSNISNDSNDSDEITNDDLKEFLKSCEDNGFYIDVVDISATYKQLMWRQTLIGLSRFIGFTVAGGIFLTLLYNVLQYLISINIPFLTDLLKTVVAIIKHS